MNYFLFLLMGLVWSASFLGIKVTVLALPPIFCAMTRVFIALLTFTIFFIGQHRSLKINLSDAMRLWIVGIISQGLPFILLFWGEQSVAPALASIINTSVAAWALLFNIIIFRDYSQMTIAKISGLVLGLLGVLAIFWPSLCECTSKFIGILSITGMAICYAIGALINQRWVIGKIPVSLRANLWHQHLGSLAFLLLMMILFEHWPSVHQVFGNGKVLLALAYLGIFSTAVAWIIYNHLIKEWGAILASSVMYIMPPLALLWDFIFLKLTPATNEILGVIIILIGITLIQFTPRRQQVISKTLTQ